MAYSQSKKLTDTEKRLEALKIQLFGKEENRIKKSANIKIHEAGKTQIFTTGATIKPQDLTYFRNDLLKILTLATLAISAELILYMLFTFKILKFN